MTERFVLTSQSTLHKVHNGGDSRCVFCNHSTCHYTAAIDMSVESAWKPISMKPVCHSCYKARTL